MGKLGVRNEELGVRDQGTGNGEWGLLYEGFASCYRAGGGERDGGFFPFLSHKGTEAQRHGGREKC